MVHGSQNRGSWASWGPTIIFSEKKSLYLNNLSLDLISYNFWKIRQRPIGQGMLQCYIFSESYKKAFPPDTKIHIQLIPNPFSWPPNSYNALSEFIEPFDLNPTYVLLSFVSSLSMIKLWCLCWPQYGTTAIIVLKFSTIQLEWLLLILCTFHITHVTF